MTLPFLASTISGHVIPAVAASSGMGSSLLVGAVVCLFSTITAVLLIVLDRQVDKSVEQLESEEEQEDEISLANSAKLGGLFWVFAIDCLITFGLLFT